MQVTEVANDGLKRAYQVVVPAGDLAAERSKRLAELGRNLRLPGFRPGKVPPKVIASRYGQAVMGEVLEQSVNQATRQVVTDRGLRPAQQPKVELVNFADGADLEFKVELEVLPEVPIPDFAGITLERLKAEPTEEAVARALDAVAARNRRLEDIEESRGAQRGEVLVCDFTGRAAPRPPNLLGEAIMGDGAGTLPPGWTLETSGGARAEPAADAVPGEAGVGLDLRCTGHVNAAGGGVILRLGAASPIVARPGEAFRIALQLSVPDGSLPQSSKVMLGLLAFDAAGAPIGRLRQEVTAPGGIPATAEARLAAAAEAVASVAAEVALALPPDCSPAFTLRLERAVLSRAEADAEAAMEPFPGNSATDMPIEVGGEGFIPGFTEQLDGMAPGETRTVAVTFPDGFGAAEMAGRAARFEVTAKALKRPVTPAVDDALASTLGFVGLDALRGMVREQIQREYDSLARLRVKRALLDALAERASFPVPDGMVEAEFSQIWQRIEPDLKAGRLDADDQGKEEAVLRGEYRAIAERRIRLGLLLSEIGRTNNITVSADELTRAMRQEAARYPGREQAVMEFFRKNPQAAENLRSPIFEEKVVDFMLELAKVEEKVVTVEELTAAAAA